MPRDTAQSSRANLIPVLSVHAAITAASILSKNSPKLIILERLNNGRVHEFAVGPNTATNATAASAISAPTDKDCIYSVFCRILRLTKIRNKHAYYEKLAIVAEICDSRRNEVDTPMPESVLSSQIAYAL